MPQGSYFDDPDELIDDAQAQKSTNEQYRITTDARSTRPDLLQCEILTTTQRATAVENDPSTYLAAKSIGGIDGRSVSPCRPAPDVTGYYEATCNQRHQ